MSAPKDGGAAFPLPGYGAFPTLRDYFAGLAMQGFAATPSRIWHNGTVGMAKNAYLWADFMIAVRST